jgi:hypothetical protein
LINRESERERGSEKSANGKTNANLLRGVNFVSASSIVVEHLTNNPKINGSHPEAGARRRKGQKGKNEKTNSNVLRALNLDRGSSTVV